MPRLTYSPFRTPRGSLSAWAGAGSRRCVWGGDSPVPIARSTVATRPRRGASARLPDSRVNDRLQRHPLLSHADDPLLELGDLSDGGTCGPRRRATDAARPRAQLVALPGPER